MNQKNNDTANFEKIGIDRLNALSDGVMAIALTLLVLGIDIPDDHDFNTEGLNLFLLKLEPGLIAYLSSFFIIGVYWIIHQKIFHVIQYTNRNVIFLNIIFLFAISLIPFVSKIKSLYPLDELVVIIFASAHIIIGIILFIIWKYFTNHPELLKSSISQQKNKFIGISILIIPMMCILAVIVAFIDIQIGTYLFILIPLIHLFINKWEKALN